MSHEEKKELTLIQDFTREQVDLIKATVAKGATDNELKLFLHNCKRLGLDPFAKQVHFVKYGATPGTIIIGVDGFRVIAARTGKHSGTKRGALYDESGRLVGAWCEVYRSDWTQPAREEVSFVEYNNPNQPIWRKMPETMIKKVAECAALRMAFPAELSGIYGHEEMDQAKEDSVSRSEPLVALRPETLESTINVDSFPSSEAIKESNRAKAKARISKNVETAVIETPQGVTLVEPHTGATMPYVPHNAPEPGQLDFNSAPAGGSIHPIDEKPGIRELDRLKQHLSAHRWSNSDLNEYMKLRFGKVRLSELNMTQFNDLMKTVGTHTSTDALRNWREGKFL
jgi:phage recombination protein Bet